MASSHPQPPTSAGDRFAKSFLPVLQVIITLALPAIAYVLSNISDKAEANSTEREKADERILVVIDKLDLRVTKLTERVDAISENRFTASDGEAVRREIASLWRDLGDRVTKSDVPPEWFEDLVRGNTKLVNDLAIKVEALKDKVHQIELKVKDQEPRQP